MEILFSRTPTFFTGFSRFPMQVKERQCGQEMREVPMSIGFVRAGAITATSFLSEDRKQDWEYGKQDLYRKH
jgi:hypothetical protein